MHELNIAITGLAGLDNPQPGLSVARSLRAGWPTPLRLHGLIYDAASTGAWMPGAFDHLHIMPPLADGEQALLARIESLHGKQALDAIIPCLDLEIFVYQRLESRLKKLGIRMLLPPEHSLHRVTKNQLAGFCHQHKILTPRSINVSHADQAGYMADQFGYPLYVKGSVAGAEKVYSANQAIDRTRLMQRKWGGDVVLQEAIIGDDYVVAALVTPGPKQTRDVRIVPVRKLGISQKGKGVAAAVIHDEELTRIARRIIDKLDWLGPLELEFVRAQNTQRFHLIEINNRFPAWIQLSHFAGANLPVTLLRYLVADSDSAEFDTEPAPARPGVAFVRDVSTHAVPFFGYNKLQQHRHYALPGPAERAISPTSKTQTAQRVAITGINSTDAIMPGLGTADALRRCGQVDALIGLSYGAYDCGAHRDRLFDSVWQLPIAATAEQLLDRLLEIQRHTGINSVIPTLDHELPLFIAIAGALNAAGINTLLPSAASLSRISKQRLAEFSAAESLHRGFKIPETIPLADPDDVGGAIEHFGLPFILKGGQVGAGRVYNLNQAKHFWEHLRKHNNRQVLAQPCIDGDEFAIAGVMDRQQRLITRVGIKKLIQCENGNTWGALPACPDRLLAPLEGLLREIQWAGPFEAEFIRDAQTDQFYLIEINPRLPAWCGFSADLGVNLGAACLSAMDTSQASGFASTPAIEHSDLVFLRALEDIPVEIAQFAALSNRRSLIHV